MERTSMTEDEVRAAADRLVQFHDRFAPLFGKEQAQDHAYTYVKGLMVCPERKSIEPIALNVGDGNVSALRKFINGAPWDHEDVQAEVQGVFIDELAPTAADPGRGQAVALQDPLDGASAGQRADGKGLEFGEDGVGPDQAVAGARRGMRLKPPTDREDGALQFGRDPLGDLLIGPGEVVEALGTGLGVAAPPLVEPELGAAQSRADILDGATAESESDGTLACGEFVLHGYLRGAAAGGCPRR